MRVTPNIALYPTDWLDANVSWALMHNAKLGSGGFCIVGFEHSFMLAFVILKKAMNQSLLSAERNGHGDPKDFACIKDGRLGFCAQLKWSPFRTMCVIPKHGPYWNFLAGCKCVMVSIEDQQIFALCLSSWYCNSEGTEHLISWINPYYLQSKVIMVTHPSDVKIQRFCMYSRRWKGWDFVAQLKCLPLGTIWVTTKYCPYPRSWLDANVMVFAWKAVDIALWVSSWIKRFLLN